MKSWIVWTPRVLGILIALFVSAFALDAFSESQPLGTALVDFGVHLVPALIVLGVVLLAWRWPSVGGGAFIALAIIYAFVSPRLDWSLVIAGPLLIVGLLFLWGSRQVAARPKAA